MFIFGVDVPILELLVVFSIVVVIYLVILEFEFRQLRTITRKFDEEDKAVYQGTQKLMVIIMIVAIIATAPEM